MALSPTQEAQVIALLAQQAAILSLASNEATITSKLGATKVTLSDLTAAGSVTGTDLLLTRQGVADKSATASVLLSYIGSALAVTAPQFDNDTSLASTAFVQRALGNYSGVTVVSTGTTALTAAHLGQLIRCTGTATVTLPTAAASPAGTAITFFSAGSTLTINRSSTDTMVSVVGAATTTLALVNGNVKLTSNGTGNWLASSGPTPLVSTTQKFTSGSGTYTTPVGARQILVRMVGGGGGSSGGGTSPGAGGGGGTTTFNSINANGGSAGSGSNGAAGGTGGTGTATLRCPGSGGGSGIPSATGTTGGGVGGSSSLAGGGAPGTAGYVNTGGGGGGGAATAVSVPTGAGGGGGEYAEIFIASPSTSYSYAVGAAGTAGTAGTSGAVGQAGGSGVIFVTEFY